MEDVTLFWCAYSRTKCAIVRAIVSCLGSSAQYFRCDRQQVTTKSSGTSLSVKLVYYCFRKHVPETIKVLHSKWIGYTPSRDHSATDTWLVREPHSEYRLPTHVQDIRMQSNKSLKINLILQENPSTNILKYLSFRIRFHSWLVENTKNIWIMFTQPCRTRPCTATIINAVQFI